MPLGDKLLAYSETHRGPILGAAVALGAGIAVADWKVQPNVSLGMLYVFPIILAAVSLHYWEVGAFAMACAFLREAFAPFRGQPGWTTRLALVWLTFAGTGLLVSALSRNRRLVLERLRERREAEQQLRVLVETSPLAILTLDAAGRVLVANASAHQLLGFDDHPLPGQDIRPFLPVLARALGHPQALGGLRTALECRGRRRNGEVFLAQAWCSTYETAAGPRLATVVWDASESLRDREDAGLDCLMTGSRVAIGAVSHELRNLAAAAATAHAGLAGVAPLDQNKDYQALGSLLHGLKTLAASGLRLAAGCQESAADLHGVLDEARIVIEPSLREAGISATWEIPDGLPVVRGDPLHLLQVFLNLARNSQRAMEEAAGKELRVTAGLEDDLVAVRFRDTGSGVAAPERLFQPFQEGAEEAGLGLYVSRAVLRSCGGDLRYEPQPAGACFVVELAPASGGPEPAA